MAFPPLFFAPFPYSGSDDEVYEYEWYHAQDDGGEDRNEDGEDDDDEDDVDDDDDEDGVDDIYI